MPEKAARVVALLRGVNVGGVKVPMGELRSLLANAGLGEVQTHLQSGNVIVTAPSGNSGAVAGVIEKAISDGLGLSIRVLVRDRSQMARIVAPTRFFGRVFLPSSSTPSSWMPRRRLIGSHPSIPIARRTIASRWRARRSSSSTAQPARGAPSST